MKTLTQYLADYIETEICRVEDNEILPNLSDWIKQGIEAYQSTENCTIGICGGACPECSIPLERDIAMLYTGENEIEVCKYECPECGYIVYG